MAKKKTIHQLIEDEYDDPEVASAVLAHAIELGTADRIVSGELTLPGNTDASHWHARKTGRVNETAIESAQRKRIDELEKKFKELSDKLDPNVPQKDFQEKLKEAIAYH